MRQDLSDDLKRLDERLESEDFYRDPPQLNTLLTTIMARTQQAAHDMSEAQRTSIHDAELALSRLPEWQELTQDEQNGVLAQLEALQVDDISHDLAGLKRLINQEFVIHPTLQDVQKRIIAIGKERIREKEEERRERARTENAYVASVPIPTAITALKSLNALLRKLEQVRAEALKHEILDITFTLREQEDDTQGVST